MPGIQTIRIFISSPGDVHEERDKARRVIDDLQKRYTGATLQPVLWEDLALPATASFQESIESVLQQQPIDIAVFILWSRMGTPLGEAIKGPNGKLYRSGTEHEFDVMLAAFEQSGKQRPVILAYARDDESGFHQTLKDCSHSELKECVDQLEKAKTFIREQFHDAAGHNIRAYHSYREPVTFAQRLHTHLSGVLNEMLVAEATPRWLTTPYRGLEVFDTQHAAIFHGREEETCDLLHRLREQQQAGCGFVVIVGASGSGKSSLARAGVGATLAERSYDDSVNEWRVVPFFPSLGGSDSAGGICLGLVRALAAKLPELRSAGTSLEDIAGVLFNDSSVAVKLSIAPAFARAAEQSKGPIRLLLILDQLEELWTDRRITPQDRAQFLLAIEALARSGHVAVLATLRSDFYSQAQNEPAFLRMKGERGHFDLPTLGTAALARLITEPARLAGIHFERDTAAGRTLDERILHDAAQDPAALPLLQYALSELYEQRAAATNTLTFAAYERMGRVAGALGRRATEIFQSLPPEAQAALPEIASLLVTIDTRGEQSAVRRRAALADLTATPARRALTEALIAARFLTTDQHDHTPIASLAHEALLARWTQLANWVNANRESLRLRARVEQSQQRWEQQGRHDSLLLPVGLPLEEARQLLGESRNILLPQTAAYIEQSITFHEAKQAQSRRVRRAVMAAMSVLTIAALVGGLFAWMKQREASKNEARANSEVARNKEQLHRASMADFASGKKAWQEDYDARSQGKWAVSIGPASKWHEAVALWTRSLEAEPTNDLVAAWLFDTLSRNAHHRWNHARQTIKHHAGIVAANFSPDGTRVVTASEDKTARLWDAAKGIPLGDPMVHQGKVNAASFSPDGTLVVTASEDKTARIWDANSGTPISEPIEHQEAVNSAKFSPDGTRVVTASGDAARLWDANGKQISQPMMHRNTVNTASFSPDGTRVVTASRDETARLWDATHGTPVGELMLHRGWVFNAKFSPDGTRVATASSDNTARLWDAASGTPIGEPMTHLGAVYVTNFSPDGTRVVTASSDKTARLWDATHGAPIGEPLPHQNVVIDANFSPDSTRVVTASSDNTARFWDVASGTPIGEPLTHQGGVRVASFSPDGTLAMTASEDKTARLWDAARGTAIGETMKHQNEVRVANFSPDGMCVVTASKDRTARLWNATDGTSLGEPMTHKGWVNTANFSPDGTRVVTASRDRTARLWSAIYGTPIGEPMTHQAVVHAANFSPDGKRVVTASWDSTARLWNALNGTPIGEPMTHQRGVRVANFSPDGTRVVTASWDNTARLWNAVHGTPICEPMIHRGTVWNANFSPDGTRVVTASWDNTAQLWDAANGKPIGEPMRHQNWVFSANFSPDGTRVVTASADKTARLWDASGKPIGDPIAHQGEVITANFSPDGTRVVTASADKTARLWNAADGTLIREPLMHQVGVHAANFSTNGTRVVTASYDKIVRLWDVPDVQPKEQIFSVDPAILTWATAVAGLRFREDGELVVVPDDERKKLLAESKLPPGPWAELAEWMKTSGTQRKLTPTSKVTLRQIAVRERDVMTQQSLESALQYDPTVPLARMMLANVLEEKSKQDPAILARAAHWRKYDLDRLPDDPELWDRAAKILRELPESQVGVGPQPTTAAEEAVKAEQKAAALRAKQSAK